MLRKVIFILILFTLPVLHIAAQQMNEPGILIQQQVNTLQQSPESLNQVRNFLYPLLTDKSRYDQLKSSLLSAMQRSPENKSLPELLDWELIQQKDFQGALIQELALDKRSNEDGIRLMELGKIAESDGALREAITAFRYVAAKGNKSRYYLQSKLEILRCMNLLIGQNFNAEHTAELEHEYQTFFSELGKNATTTEAVYDYAVFTFQYLHNATKAGSLLDECIHTPGIAPVLQAQCKLQLGDIMLTQGKIWDAALLYGQVDKSFREDSLGQEAKFRAAKIYFYSGDFTLAKSQLDILKTATTELIANDAMDLSLLIQEQTAGDSTGAAALKKYAHSELLIFQHKYAEAAHLLDSISLLPAASSMQDLLLMSQSDIDLKLHHFREAAGKLKKLTEQFPKGIWADNALFELAQVQEYQLKDLNNASRLFEQLILNYPGSYFVPESRKEFRKLRGDKEF